MQFKLVIYTSTKVIYMIVSEDELDSIYNQFRFLYLHLKHLSKLRN